MYLNFCTGTRRWRGDKRRIVAGERNVKQSVRTKQKKGGGDEKEEGREKWRKGKEVSATRMR